MQEESGPRTHIARTNVVEHVILRTNMVALSLVRSRVVQKLAQARGNACGLSELTFPDDQNAPACSPELTASCAVTCDIACKLLGPEGRACLRCGSTVLASVTVPEASMHKDHRSQPPQDDVRLSGQVARMEPKPKPQCMHHPLDGKLGRRVATLHGGHAARALLPREHIHALACTSLAAHSMNSSTYSSLTPGTLG